MIPPRFRRHISRVSLRTAAPVSVFAGLVSYLQWTLLAGGEWVTGALVATATTLLLFSATYLVMVLQHYRRLEFIDRVTRDIMRKQFGEYQHVRTRSRDEIDHLLRQTILASEKIEREITRLNKIENYRKEFIGDVSHELKTPIFAIQGFIETLLNGAMDDPEVNQVFLRKAMKNVNRLITLVQELMEISRIETGELKSTPVDFSLRDLLREVIDSLQHKATQEQVTLTLQRFDDRLSVNADRDLMRHVFVNLIENGIKYNVKGGQVDVGLKPFPKKNNRVLVYVRDTGIGIDPQNISRVTERFFRADKSRSREKGGTGLGLSIVKHIVQAHGENLYIESDRGKGSTFSLTLPRTTGILLSNEEP